MKLYPNGTWVKMRGLYIAAGKVRCYRDNDQTVEVVEPSGQIVWMNTRGIIKATKSDIERCEEKFRNAVSEPKTA